MRRLPASEVIETVRTAGGVTSLAHPGRIRADAETVADHVAHLAAAGLDAVEVAYPYETERSPAYAGIGVAEAAELAVTEGLRVTGGSDCHGPGSGKFRLGETGVGAAELAALRALARRRGSRPIAPRS
jgi:predicted metal-dependent phosphoesterase TrpH